MSNGLATHLGPAAREPEMLLHAFRASDVAATKVDWLWPGRIASGKVTLLAGDPGLGKSLLTLDMAARVSRGGRWPEERGQGSEVGGQGSEAECADAACMVDSLGPRPAASAIIFSDEDDASDTIRPRLDAAGADCSRVVIVPSIAGKDENGEYRRAFDLSRDMVTLDRMLDRLPDCRLVVIDPISSYLGSSIENTNTEVRGLLGPLAALAAARNLAVIAVTHLRKKDGATIYRALGSLAFVAASRAAWIVCQDPTDAERKLFLPVKNNLSGCKTGLAYRIESHSLGELDAPIVCWLEEAVSVAADTALCRPARPMGRPDSERTAATNWLERFLAAGPERAADVREAAEGHGFTYGTLRKAFRDLGGESTREEDGGVQRWLWELPTPAGIVSGDHF